MPNLMSELDVQRCFSVFNIDTMEIKPVDSQEDEENSFDLEN